jgi:hypothetical protein
MIKSLPRRLLNHAVVIIDNLITPHERRIRQVTGRPYFYAILTLPVFFLTNYLFNHQAFWLDFSPEGSYMYFFAVILPFGVLLPSLSLGWLIREADGEAHLFGATLKYRDLKLMALAFGTGVIIIVIPVGQRILYDFHLFGTIIHLFIWVFMVSLAEVLLFHGVVFNAAFWLALKWFPGRNRILMRTIMAVTLSALIYAIFHLTYNPPWNNGDTILILIPFGLLVSLFFAYTRSLAATVIFNNVLKSAGYLIVGTVIIGSDLLGLVLNGIMIFAVALILLLVGVYDEDF